MPLPTPGIVDDPAIERALQDIRNRVPDTRNIFTPSSIAAGVTWSVPAGVQLFFADVMDAQGTLDVQGELVSVDLPTPLLTTYLFSGSTQTITNTATDITSLTYTTDRPGSWAVSATVTINIQAVGVGAVFVGLAVNGILQTGQLVAGDILLNLTLPQNWLVSNIAPGTTMKLQVFKFNAGGTAVLNSHHTMTIRQV